jgi:hypothetical protein
MIGRCYDGKLMGKFELSRSLDMSSNYLLQVGFSDINLKDFIGDSIPQPDPKSEHSTGNISGSLSVDGSLDRLSDSASSKVGTCRLSITDMQVGKLSLLSKLLNVLQLAVPEDFAFDRMTVDSYLKDEQVLIRYVGLTGSKAAFSGSGWIDLQSDEISLILYAGDSRATGTKYPVLQSFTTSLGYAVVRIEVSGKYYDPQIITQALPVIQDTLKLLGTKAPKPGG